MASFTYDAAITDREYPEWESWLADISNDEATRLLKGTGIAVGDTIDDQAEYDKLMLATRKYYKGIK